PLSPHFLSFLFSSSASTTAVLQLIATSVLSIGASRATWPSTTPQLPSLELQVGGLEARASSVQKCAHLVSSRIEEIWSLFPFSKDRLVHFYKPESPYSLLSLGIVFLCIHSSLTLFALYSHSFSSPGRPSLLSLSP